ncbi:MAG: DUF3050 domain-containing protein [Planctomycetes bacterium]|nr:DUF3050 domain-containing protein [Planctomycetota bacterium]
MDSILVTDEVTSDSIDHSTLRQQLFQHPLYDSVQTADSLRLFMREHVFAVWDFMSLLKRLQQLVTCCDVPWMPPTDANVCRFINEIVLGEECDEDGRGGYASHFELYLQAMDEVGADARPIRTFIGALRDGISIESALMAASILPTTRDFVRSTLQLARHGQPHEVAAAFFHGREDVIPDMFSRLVRSLPQQGVKVDRLVHYLNRHIELDANDHGPLARRLVENLCQGIPARLQAADRTAVQSVRARIGLWDGVYGAIRQVTA